MNKNHLARFFILSSFGAAALAASVPNTFTAGAPAVAADVNANFAALVSAATALESKVAALETKVAALESVNSPLTAAEVTGSYKLLSLQNQTKSNAAELLFGAQSSASDITLNFTATGSTGGTFSYTGNHKSAGFSAKATQCNSEGNFATSSSGPSTSGSTGTHFHQYLHATCTAGGFVNAEDSPDESDSGSGTWVLGSGDTIVITPPAGEGESPNSFTVYFSKAGQVGFGLEVQDESDGNSSGRRFSMDVLIRQ
ncbi:MAG: hypothetical protein Q8Q73_13180 [Stagnimonas sp.]|nr:hypothetical protein [Stagnimonas sp.]